MKVDHDRIKKLIDRRLIVIPDDIKKCFPNIIRREIRWVSFSNEELLILIFLDSDEMKRIQEYSKNGYDLFPGFITTKQSIGAGMRLENSKNNLISGCSVSGMYSFSVGKDTSFIVQDHLQTLQTNELGEIKYKIPLAYVISFGERISENNAYESLEELIAYSVKIWRETNEPSA